MPMCSKCHPIFDLGRICPHEGPGRQVWEAGYVEGVKATWSDLSEPPPERAILFDLIAELRDTADVKPGATGRLLREMAGSAEARLREVGRS